MLVKFVAVTDNFGLDHFPEQVVALAGALADAGKNREAVRADGDVIDQLHDKNRLANTGPAKETDLAAAKKRLNKVDDLDARLKHLERCRLFVKTRRMTVDR